MPSEPAEVLERNDFLAASPVVERVVRTEVLEVVRRGAGVVAVSDPAVDVLCRPVVAVDATDARVRTDDVTEGALPAVVVVVVRLAIDGPADAADAAGGGGVLGVARLEAVVRDDATDATDRGRAAVGVVGVLAVSGGRDGAVGVRAAGLTTLLVPAVDEWTDDRRAVKGAELAVVILAALLASIGAGGGARLGAGGATGDARTAASIGRVAFAAGVRRENVEVEFEAIEFRAAVRLTTDARNDVVPLAASDPTDGLLATDDRSPVRLITDGAVSMIGASKSSGFCSISANDQHNRGA